MRSVCYLFLLLICCAVFFVTSSCGDCSGCDEIFTTEAAAFRIADTTIELRDALAVAQIRVERVVSKRPGTRHCRYRNQVTCMEDGIDSSKLEIYCTRDLLLAEGTVTAGTNLLHQSALLSPSTSPGVDVPTIILRAGPLFPPGIYTFLLRGQTRQGKEIEDIAHIRWD